MATSPLTSRPTKRISPLLRLPVELRLEIYSYLLCHKPDTSQHVHSRTTCSDEPEPINAAILLVNRQLNYEATPILYSQNTFLAHYSLLTSFPRLRHALPPVTEDSVLCLLRRVHLTIRLDCGPAFNEDTAKRMLSGLEELTIELTQGLFIGAGCQNLRALEGVRGVKDVKVCGSTTGFEIYLAWLRDAMMSPPGAKSEKFKPGEETFWANKFVKCNNLIVV